MNKKEQRHRELTALLQQRPELTIQKLSDIFQVSQMTIRRDLNALQKRNAITNANHFEYRFIEEQKKFSAEKLAIAKYAASFIEPNDIIALDNGSTIAAFSAFIPSDQNITVVCNNFYSLSQILCKEGISVIFPGGYFHRHDAFFESDEGIQLLKNHRITKLFMSAYGIHESLGITCGHGYEIPTKRVLLENSLCKILLADSSKFGQIRNAYVSSLDTIDIIITDNKISDKWRTTIENLGIELHIL